MKVLGLSSYPVEAAATRFRLAQFVEPLRERGIELSIRPFLTSQQFQNFYRPDYGVVKKAAGMVPAMLRRLGEVVAVGGYDVILVQREAMFFGPAVIEWLLKNLRGKPLVLDLDDATYVPYVSPTYGRFASILKAFGKTDNLIRRSDVVICGNRFIAKHVEELGSRAVVIPTIADPIEFVPVDKDNDPPVIGWVGTHSTYPFLARLLPVLEKLAAKYAFELKVVGSGLDEISIPRVKTTVLPWRLDREIPDFQSLDIGLYPISVSKSANEEWLQGKSGFKAIQYLAVGVPYVVSPVGVCTEIGEAGRTHYEATSDDEWYSHLERLLSNAGLRAEMGDNGRRHSLEHYSVPQHADVLANVLREVKRP